MLAGEFFYQLFVFGVLLGQGCAICQLKVCEVEAWCYGAAYQCVFTAWCGYGGEPASGSYDGLKAFSFFGVCAEEMGDEPSIVVDLIDQQGVSEVKMPYFIGGDAVKGGELAGCEQKVNTCGGAAVALKEEGQDGAGDGQLRPVYFPEGAAFDVLGQL